MLSAPSSEQADQAGFTLVELVIVSTLMVLVLGAILGVLDNLTRSQRTTSARIDASQSARFTLAQLSRDLRSARVVLKAGSSEVDLVLSDQTSTKVEWAFAAGTFKRYVGPILPANATAVLPNVVSGNFSFSPALASGTSGDAANCVAIVTTTVSVKISTQVAAQNQTVVDQLPNQVRSPACG